MPRAKNSLSKDTSAFIGFVTPAIAHRSAQLGHLSSWLPVQHFACPLPGSFTSSGATGHVPFGQVVLAGSLLTGGCWSFDPENARITYGQVPKTVSQKYQRESATCCRWPRWQCLGWSRLETQSWASFTLKESQFSVVFFQTQEANPLCSISHVAYISVFL